ncbi:MAG: acetate--CoA ligase family protein, partial [Patescibacteria group bacterium]
LYASPARHPSSEVVVVTNAGGPAIIAADEIAKTDLRLALLPEQLQKRLRRILNRAGEIHNPIDLVGDAKFDIFKKTIDTLLHEDSFGNILIIVTPQTVTPIEDLARYIGRVNKKTDKHILSCFIGGKRVEPAHRILSSFGTSNFTFPYDAIHTLALSKKFFAPRERLVTEIADDTRGEAGAFLSYERMQRYLSRRGMPYTKGVVVRKSSDIQKVRSYPIAMKALSTRALHKARSNALRLNVASQSAAESVFTELSGLFSGKGLEGVLAQPMVSGGREFFIGIKRDPQFGLVTLFGIGGTLAEELHDIVMRVGILSKRHVGDMLAELRNQHLLQDCDIRFISDLLLSINLMAARDPKMLELDCNPVVVFRQGGTIIDARIRYAAK